MLPRLDSDLAVAVPYGAFLRSLRERGFSGETATDAATRFTHATDNSVYQLLPQAVVFPRSHRDVVLAAKLASEPAFRKVTLTARGGGTGTNGQSLSDGITVDLSRHMNRILEINATERWVRVEPGVILDQLNATLAPLGLFFAPNVSPSNRATLGGMVSTDACGRGSRVYGKTSEHVLGLSLVFVDGSEWTSAPIHPAQLPDMMRRPDRLGEVLRTVHDIVTTHRDAIRRTFPRVPRFLTGYDLANVVAPDGSFDLGRLITGSEGTLAFVTEAQLRVLPIPACRRVVAIRYACFDDALAAAQELVASDPSAIETVDDKILTLAREDPVWHKVGRLLDGDAGGSAGALNLVEFSGDDAQAIGSKARSLTDQLARHLGSAGKALGFVVAREPAEQAALWELRKKGVGLLGNTPGARRPVAFVEDTAVPPEALAAYVREFTKLLEDAGLEYGIFGHVDVGCIHVRPALNLRDPKDEVLLRQITERVVALVKKYGGVLWAEHGKGFRSEYSPHFFGEDLYRQLCRVKQAFDPYNQLNPGKLAVPPENDGRLATIDAPTRGQADRQIQPASLERYATSVNCNGNGACFDYSADSVMCPSAKVTRDRVHSPKGRATMMREWLRRLSELGYDPTAEVGRPVDHGAWDQRLSNRSRSAEEYDFSHEVYSAMDGCLSCKACATQCPVKVDVPELKSEFLDLYHRRYARPLKDHFLAALESVVVFLSWLPRLFNLLMSIGWVQALIRRVVGMVDIPRLSEQTLRQGLRQRGARRLDLARLEALPADQKARHVLLIQDAFTSFYESHVVLACYDLAKRLGFEPVVVPYRPSGKALHVKGFVHRFRRTVHANAAYYRKLAELGIKMVGIDPAVTLAYRDEYARVLGGDTGFCVLLFQEWLVSERGPIEDQLRRSGYRAPETTAYSLMGHCTEKTLAPASQRDWCQAFALFGLQLELGSVGCCGMSGAYGHEASHRDESVGIYEMSWRRHLPGDPELRRRFLAPGYSCRSQVKRLDGQPLRHPASALLEAVEGSQDSPDAGAHDTGTPGPRESARSTM